MIEFKKLLSDDPSMKVTLNSKDEQLHDATVPFSIGFSEEVAEMQPTHILLIAIPYSAYEGIEFEQGENEHEKKENEFSELNETLQNVGERKLYELSKINYIQFSKPGRYNLVFVLLNELSISDRTTLVSKESMADNYRYNIYLSSITDNNSYFNSIAYAELLVEIPEELFAPVPKSRLKKFWWKWVNRWFDSGPTDECEFRKRMGLALTIQPVIWILGIFARLLWGTIVAAVSILIFVVFYIIGVHVSNIKATLIDIVRYVFLYPSTTWWHVRNFNFYSKNSWDKTYKVYTVFNREVKAYISPSGLIIQLALWRIWLYSAKHIAGGESMQQKIVFTAIALLVLAVIICNLALIISSSPNQDVKQWVKKYFSKEQKEESVRVIKFCYLICSIIIVAMFIAFNYAEFSVNYARVLSYTTSNWMYVVVILGIALLSIKRKAVQRWWRTEIIAQDKKNLDTLGNKIKISEEEQRVQWFKKHMNISSVKKPLDIQNVIAPTKTEQLILRFKVSFWSMKAKICKPYPRA